MDRTEKITEICQQLEVVVRCGQHMRNHTALGVGGKIAAIAYPETPEAAVQLVVELEKEQIPWSALGSGSRLLVHDSSVDRVAISLKLLEEVLLFKDNKVQVHAGYRMSRLALAIAERGFQDVSKFASYLGTVGAALRHRESLFFGSVKNFLCVYDGKLTKISGDQLNEVGKQEVEKYLRLVLGVELELNAENSELIKKKQIKKINSKIKTQQSHLQGTGPVFVEKIGRRSSIKLIEAAGLKGLTCGDAMVWSNNANFIVNKGKATADQVLELIDQVKNKVKDHSGLELKLALEKWQ